MSRDAMSLENRLMILPVGVSCAQLLDEMVDVSYEDELTLYHDSETFITLRTN